MKLKAGIKEVGLGLPLRSVLQIEVSNPLAHFLPMHWPHLYHVPHKLELEDCGLNPGGNLIPFLFVFQW